jgi:Glycosyl transferase family 2
MITAVIPLYNKAGTVGRALRSVLEQTVQDCEVIVVDDGSTDDGGRIVASCADRRIRLIRQANAGVSAARNRGVVEATHELIAFLDADDWWEAFHLEDILHLRRRYPDAAMYATALAIRDDMGLIRPARAAGDVGEKIGAAEYFALAVRSGFPVHSSSVAVTRSMLRQVGGFPEGIKVGEDLLTWARLACVGPLAYSSRISATFQQSSIAAADRPKVTRPPPKDDPVGAALRDLDQRYGASCPSLREFLGLWFRMRALQYLDVGDHLATFREIRFAISADRIDRKDLGIVVLNCLPRALSARLLEADRRRRYRRHTA